MAFAEANGLGKPGIVDVADCQVCAALRKVDGQGSPDARTGSGDRCGGATKVFHGMSLAQQM